VEVETDGHSGRVERSETSSGVACTAYLNGRSVSSWLQRVRAILQQSFLGDFNLESAQSSHTSIAQASTVSVQPLSSPRSCPPARLDSAAFSSEKREIVKP